MPIVAILLASATLLTSATLLATPAAAQAALPPLSCRTFPKDASAASLAKTFGAGNVKDAEIYVGEGASEPGTALFPDDPLRRVEILWFDEANRRRPSYIGVKEHSDWVVKLPGTAERDIRIGAPIDLVQQANGRPFDVKGFGWDLGGWATDMKDGRLRRMDGGCSLTLRFEPDANAKDADLDKVSGDRVLSSGASVVRAVRPRVSTMALGWPVD